MSLHTSYLSCLQQSSESSDVSSLCLWPNTPIDGTIQERIRERVGAADDELENRLSRPSRIIRWIERMVKAGCVPPAFSLLDIACGDALILCSVKKRFPESQCHGLDANKGAFTGHVSAERLGVHLFRGFIQHLFSQPEAPVFDVLLMLNTYRSWQSAQLRPGEQSLPQQADQWLQTHGRYVILTMTAEQLTSWRRRGFNVKRLGKGEERSMMVVCSLQRLPSGFALF